MRKSTYAWIGAVATACAVASAVPALASDDALLPDLRQAPVGCTAGYDGDPGSCTAWDVCPVADASKPSGTCVTSGPIQAVRLRFTSSEENVGAGPLLLYGHRDSTATPTMKVRQAFQTGEGGPIPASFDAAQHPTGATTYYEPAAMHRHWHLLDFDRFQLRDSTGNVLVADRKNGFCLGDRYPVSGEAQPQDGTPEGELAAILADSTCKRRIPEALDVTEGISVGMGDNYDYTVDYQWLELTTVPSGTYTVVNTVNPDRSILESSYANNSSSMAISVQWPGGGAAPSPITKAPVVKMLRSCPGSATCPA